MRRPRALFIAAFLLAASPSFGQEEMPDLTKYENLATGIGIDTELAKEVLETMTTPQANAPDQESLRQELETIFTRAKASARDLKVEEALLDEVMPVWASKCNTEEACDEAMIFLTIYAFERVVSAQTVAEMEALAMISEFALAADVRLSFEN